MVTINSNADVTIFGTELIKEGVFNWKIKIISFIKKSDYPYIGIFENDDNRLRGYLDDSEFEDCAK